MTEWTNGETVIENIVREGHVRESFLVKDAPPTVRQRGKGKFQPCAVTFYFSTYSGPWECHGAVVSGKVIKADGSLSLGSTKAEYRSFIDDEYTDAPAWLVHLAKSRLAVLQYTTNGHRA